MKCLLASMGFINENIEYNKNVIINTLKKYSKIADIVIFGEAYLQGFYALNFDVDHDTKIAVASKGPIINEIRKTSKKYNIGVSFGFIEKEGKSFYSSQITIDKNGLIIDIFRRVSPGWKESSATVQYLEGESFRVFEFMNNKIAIGLCGDLWFENNVDKIKAIKPEVVFWPVYTDFASEIWNSTEKHEYAKQANRFCNKVLYVNSLNMDKDSLEYAKGGSAFFENGTRRQEAPSGKEATLLVEI